MKRKVSKNEMRQRLAARKARKRHAEIWQSLYAGLLTQEQAVREHEKVDGIPRQYP